MLVEATSYSGFVRTDDKFYSLGEEIANAITHGLAFAAAVVGLVFLILYACRHGNALHVTTFSIFGASLILLYLSSTLYHSIPGIKAKKVLQMMDHSAIFLLIAGSYTPFMLNLIHNWVGIVVVSIVWAIALFGIIFQSWLLKKGDLPNTILYLAQGWTVLIAAGYVYDALPLSGLVLLICGGLAYSLGCIFFMWQRLPYHHAIWHMFVLGGSALHYFAVFYTV